jgi:hypothetical protein
VGDAERAGERDDEGERVGAPPEGDSEPHALGVPVPGIADAELEGASEGVPDSRAEALGERESRKPVWDDVKVALGVFCADSEERALVGMAVSDSVRDADAEPLWERDASRDLRGEMERLAVIKPVRVRVPPRPARSKEALLEAVSERSAVPVEHMERERSTEPLAEAERDAEGVDEGVAETRALALAEEAVEPLGVADGEGE